MWRNADVKSVADIFHSPGFDGIVVFDTETTGLSRTYARIVELAAVKLDKDLNEVGEFCSLCNPGVPIPDEASMIHGITDEMVADKPFCDDIVEKFVDEFVSGLPLAAYNGDRYDIPLIKNAMARRGRDFDCRSIDILNIARKVYVNDGLPDNKLETIARHVGFVGDFHTAMDDTRAAVEILRASIGTFLEGDKPCSFKGPIKILSASFWGPRHTLSRIYVKTNVGELYFDVYKGSWVGKTVDVESLPMEEIEALSCAFVGAKDLSEFRKWRGKKAC